MVKIFATKRNPDPVKPWTNEEILSDNGLRSQGTPDLMDVWQGKTK